MLCVQIQDAIKVHVYRTLDVDPETKASERGAGVTKGADHVVLEWASTFVNDMIADSLVSLILSIEASPGSARGRFTLYPSIHKQPTVY